jgi:hypothetical protein
MPVSDANLLCTTSLCTLYVYNFPENIDMSLAHLFLRILAYPPDRSAFQTMELNISTRVRVGPRAFDVLSGLELLGARHCSVATRCQTETQAGTESLTI